MKKLLIILIWSVVALSAATPVWAFPTLIPPECAGTATLGKDIAGNPLCDSCPISMTNAERQAKETAYRTGAAGAKPKPCCCDLSSVERIAVNVTQIILGISGSLALLTFVVGGILYMTSGGESGKVQKATTMLKTAVIGIAIILLAGIIVQTILKKLTGL